MEEQRKKESGINVMVIILLIVIAIAGAILVLKMTGIIKPEEKDYTTSKYNNNTTTNNITNNNYQSTLSAKDKENLSSIISTKVQTARIMRNVFTIVLFVVEIGLNIGICKLYKKLKIPAYIITFTFLWPILSIIEGFFNNWFGIILSIIYSILQIASLFYYFKSVGMSGVWAFVPTGSLLLTAFGTSAAIMGGVGLMALTGLIGIIAFLIAYVISNIKLAKIFNKGTGFTVGLALLPVIFQPILGYSKTENPANE